MPRRWDDTPPMGGVLVAYRTRTEEGEKVDLIPWAPGVALPVVGDFVQGLPSLTPFGSGVGRKVVITERIIDPSGIERFATLLVTLRCELMPA